MFFTDSHCHLFLEEFDSDRDAMIQKSLTEGINHFILPNVDVSTINRLKSCCNEYPTMCKALIGLHPTSVKETYIEELAIIEKETETGFYSGIGEIGIDLYWDKTFLNQQVEAFIFQLKLAQKYNFATAIHIRNSFEETFMALGKSNLTHFKGVFHCFSGTKDQAFRAIELGFKIGIGGVVTFKNSGLDEILKAIDINDIILETDAPYLAPTPYRGKRNEPSYLILIAKKIAEIKNISLVDVADITTRNCNNLF